ncbi:LuxR C-terminal-related transcriptional regulator [Streptomyces sp. NPDC020965]|uniref:LuxR C-terminal-related transcriptional regulator n=1 Tax=Streptomyces sp. NPDC020965 TaxID=3365105 RepID=UPI0037A526A6
MPAPPAAARCLVVLGSTAPMPMDRIVRRVTAPYGERAAVRSTACRRGDGATEHEVLRRLFGASDGGYDGTHPAGPDLAHTAGERADALLATAPLVLALVDAHWCDDGTLRWIDRLLRRTSGGPLTVLMTSSHRALAAGRPTFHEIVAQEYSTVTDAAGLLAPDTDPSDGSDLDDLLAHEPYLIRVARAASALRSTDAELVGALARLPARQVTKALKTARAAGVIPDPMPPMGVPHPVDALLAELTPAERERMYAQAAEILNDTARPAEEVADLLLAHSRLDRPWMISLLKEAAADAQHHNPAAAVRYLSRLNRVDPDDLGTSVDLAMALLDIDPVTARGHLEWALLRTSDPLATARWVMPLRLTALMTHEEPDTPGPLGDVLRDLRDDDRAGVGAPGGPEPSPHGRVPPVPPTRLNRPAATGPQPALSRAGSAVGQLALATRAIRTALTGTAMREAVGDAHQVLQAERPGSAWATVAAAQVLGLADQTEPALGHLTRTIADSQRREEVWAECHARSSQAWLLLQTGEVAESTAQARAASRIAHRHGWEAQTQLPLITLALSMITQAKLDRAECALRRLDGRRFDDSVWEFHHHLMAQALLHRMRGRTEQALDLMDACGTSLASAGVDNPVFSTWWVVSTDLLMQLGRVTAAVDRAELGAQLAKRWPTQRSTGLGLLAKGMAAQQYDRVQLLTESVRVLANCPDRPYHTLAELRLGQALLEHDDKKAARAHLHTARTLATQHGFLVMAHRARVALATAGGRAPSADHRTGDTLTSAERPVAALAASGTTNRDIAAALFLSLRTVEFHLTNVYRKLGVTGRAELAERLDPESAPTPWRPSGEPR